MKIGTQGQSRSAYRLEATILNKAQCLPWVPIFIGTSGTRRGASAHSDPALAYRFAGDEGADVLGRGFTRLLSVDHADVEVFAQGADAAILELDDAGIGR